MCVLSIATLGDNILSHPSIPSHRSLPKSRTGSYIGPGPLYRCHDMYSKHCAFHARNHEAHQQSADAEGGGREGCERCRNERVVGEVGEVECDKSCDGARGKSAGFECFSSRDEEVGKGTKSCCTLGSLVHFPPIFLCLSVKRVGYSCNYPWKSIEDMLVARPDGPTTSRAYYLKFPSARIAILLTNFLKISVHIPDRLC